jgi:hypothetical protein
VSTDGGYKNVTVSVSMSGKPLGVDAWVKVEGSWEFPEPVDKAGFEERHSLMLEHLESALLEDVEGLASTVRTAAAQRPQGHASVHPVNPAPAPQGTQAGVQAAGPAAVQAVQVANGAAPQQSGGLVWASAPDRFDGSKQVRYVTSGSYSTEQMRADVATWLTGKGLNADAFITWDERTGPRGAESGAAISSVAAVKVKDDYLPHLPSEAVMTQNGKGKAVARAKFNHDGSLYIWFDKGFEAALKYGACSAVQAGAAPAGNPF